MVVIGTLASDHKACSSAIAGAKGRFSPQVCALIGTGQLDQPPIAAVSISTAWSRTPEGRLHSDPGRAADDDRPEARRDCEPIDGRQDRKLGQPVVQRQQGRSPEIPRRKRRESGRSSRLNEWPGELLNWNEPFFVDPRRVEVERINLSIQCRNRPPRSTSRMIAVRWAEPMRAGPGRVRAKENHR